MIPIFEPYLSGNEKKYLVDCIDSTWISSQGDYILKFEKKIARYHGMEHAVVTSSCTSALHLSLKSLNIGPGDEVICPAVNFKAAHMAILDRNAKVVFCEIDPITYNLDPEDVLKKITKNTRAIIPVHLHGLSAPMNDLKIIAEKNPHKIHGPIKIIGDAARAIGAGYNGKKVGHDGWATSFSFQSQKLITTLGEGGAIVTNDTKLADKVRDMCSYGGESGWGMNYRMNKVQAAVGEVQLGRINELINRRRKIAERRGSILNKLQDIKLPEEPDNFIHAFYVYPILVKNKWGGKKRDLIIKIMQERYGIVCSITNRPVYDRWSYIKKMCGNPNLEISDNISSRLFCPIIHPDLNDEQEKYINASIIETIKSLG